MNENNRQVTMGILSQSSKWDTDKHSPDFFFTSLPIPFWYEENDVSCLLIFLKQSLFLVLHFLLIVVVPASLATCLHVHVLFAPRQTLRGKCYMRMWECDRGSQTKTVTCVCLFCRKQNYISIRSVFSTFSHQN